MAELGPTRMPRLRYPSVRRVLDPPQWRPMVWYLLPLAEAGGPPLLPGRSFPKGALTSYRRRSAAATSPLRVKQSGGCETSDECRRNGNAVRLIARSPGDVPTIEGGTLATKWMGDATRLHIRGLGFASSFTVSTGGFRRQPHQMTEVKGTHTSGGAFSGPEALLSVLPTAQPLLLRILASRASMRPGFSSASTTFLLYSWPFRFQHQAFSLPSALLAFQLPMITSVEHAKRSYQRGA